MLLDTFKERRGAVRARSLHNPTINSTLTDATSITEAKAAISEAMAASLPPHRLLPEKTLAIIETPVSVICDLRCLARSLMHRDPLKSLSSTRSKIDAGSFFPTVPFHHEFVRSEFDALHAMHLHLTPPF
jgi:hypothetical protein